MSDKTCAVMLEAIQGEGGVHVPDPDYLPKVRALCDKYNAVLSSMKFNAVWVVLVHSLVANNLV